ncbi:MAG: hypothetical protein AVDCRST_MAG73-4028 [uncultured Thermomicrobiales bacterium]|uniref:Uncharacterized protein n=1 Tax=uncultured Thermomicrobiales bacterium TaxID=1645740 RepID=A0A6J4UYQ1_9BACT|nr:MAG: hypothetical protein AVDCRST_MAG73-4028 [uncultured Thermomicrobiales bacterium]
MREDDGGPDNGDGKSALDPSGEDAARTAGVRDAVALLAEVSIPGGDWSGLDGFDPRWDRTG